MGIYQEYNYAQAINRPMVQKRGPAGEPYIEPRLGRQVINIKQSDDDCPERVRFFSMTKEERRAESERLAAERASKRLACSPSEQERIMDAAENCIEPGFRVGRFLWHGRELRAVLGDGAAQRTGRPCVDEYLNVYLGDVKICRRLHCMDREVWRAKQVRAMQAARSAERQARRTAA